MVDINFNSTCDFFRFITHNTWKRIRLARRAGLRVYETTITQNILYYAFLFSQQHPAHMQLFEAVDEKANGNDLEIIIKTARGYVKLPTQAKILYASGYYGALKHDQLHDLIRYARSPAVRGIPLYLFYNYFNGDFHVPQTLDNIQVTRADYGCTVCNAHVLKQISARAFSHLHPEFCDPFWRISCCQSDTDNIISLKEMLKADHLRYDIATYTEDELSKEQSWQPFILEDDDEESKDLGFTESKKGNKRFGPVTREAETGFNPRFRIKVN